MKKVGMKSRTINSKWIKWSDRTKIPDGNQPGVYCIAHAKNSLSGVKFSLIKDIIYIGVSISKNGVKGRLYQFEKAMFGKDRLHGGAERVRFKHRKPDLFFKQAYISVVSFPCTVDRTTPEDWRQMGECLKHEYVSIAGYLERFGQLPEFNDQKRSLKK